MAQSEDGIVERLSERYKVSTSAVRAALDALRSGRGQAQFSHPDFGGMSQWSRGMTMVGDMFNSDFKAKLDGICTDLSAYLADNPEKAKSEASPIKDDAAKSSGDWWPGDLGSPSAVGGQNDLRYAVFPSSRRLVIDDHGRMATYDTGDHQIHGVAQAQSTDRTLSFTSQNGVVSIADLAKVSD
jgi:hypothetical protein